MNTQKLKGKMAEAGYSNRTIAPLIGVSETTFGRKINGKARFDCVEAVALCELLHITDASEMVNIFLS